MNVCSIAPSTRDDLLAGDEPDGVDDVGVEIAVRARAGDVALEPPQQRCVRAAPALQVGRRARGRSGRSLPAATRRWARATAGTRR